MNNETLISAGYVGIFSIIFSETGLLFGVLLPGDSLLFAAGVLCAEGYFDVHTMALGCFIAGLIGNIAGYEQGRRWGRPFVDKHALRVITQDKIDKTYFYLNKYKQLGLVISRFFPAARTLAPFLAGVIHMNYLSFILFSIIGALLWAVGLVYLGFHLGAYIPAGWTHFLVIPLLVFVIGAMLVPYLKKIRKK